jgi:uncharacterized protein YoxC
MNAVISLIVLSIAVTILIWTSTKVGSIKRNILYTANIVQELRQQLIDINRQANDSIHKFNLLNKRLEEMTGKDVDLITELDIDNFVNDINLANPKLQQYCKCENTIKLEDE